MRIGLIGVGNMGYPLFQRLLKQQHKVNILIDPYNPRNFQRCSLFRPEQINQFILESDTIFSILPRSTITKDLVAHIKEPVVQTKYWVDLCCSCPKDAKEINLNLLNLGIEYMDAPVSGTPKNMTNGDLSTIISGPITCYQKTYDLVSSYNKNIFYISDQVGTASSVKLANNALLAANMIALGEVLNMLYKNNVDVDEALHFINSSSGRSWVSTHQFPNHILDNHFDTGFSYELHKKDILTFLRSEYLEDSYILKTLVEVYNNPDHIFKDHTEIVKIIK